MSEQGLPAAYIPIDRRLALLHGESLPEFCEGAVLLADIRGFTSLGEKLAQQLGLAQGAEELNRQVNVCFADLIAAVHSFRGAVVNFSGDALLAVFSGAPDPVARGFAAAQAIQAAMHRHASLSLRIGLGQGTIRRHLLGGPAHGLHDLLGGPALALAVAALGRSAAGGCAGLEQAGPSQPCAWPAADWEDLPEGIVRAWVPPEVYDRLTGGAAAFVAELRQVVPLFLQVDCDPEDLADYVVQVQSVLASFQTRLSSIEILDKGTVLVAFWGAPVARADDPLQAVAAALALTEAGRRWGRLRGLRIGLSMGPLYAGLVGSPARLSYTVYGGEMNLAARLMETAGLWEVLVSERLQQATCARYRFASRRPISLKGRYQQVQVAHLEAARAPVGRPDRGPLVGRRRELTQLQAVEQQVRSGRGQVFVLQGEAGIGKSHLAGAFLRRWHESGNPAFMGQAQATIQQQPYLAWGELLRHLFDLRGEEQDVIRLQEAVAQADPLLLPRLPLLGDVLGVAIPETDLTRSLDARLRQASTQSLILQILQAHPGPLLLLLEDIHWMDGPSWSLTLAVARGLANHALLLLLTARPMEPRPTSWELLGQLPCYQESALTAFSSAEALELARVRLGLRDIPDALADFLQAHGQGNPFFIEEILHTLYEEGFWGRQGAQLVIRRPLDEAQLPANVHGVVLARIDRLAEPNRLTLKVASVIGRVFAYPVLSSVHPLHEQEGAALREHLESLQSFDIVRFESPTPEEAYIFKHAVTHEVAYGTLLYAQRRELHASIARYYERRYGSHLEPYYALLAYHCGRSGDEERHLFYCRRAGEEAGRRFAHAEAISFYTEALGLLDRRGERLRGEALRENDRQRWDLLAKREGIYDLIGQHQEQRADIAELLRLARDLDEPDRYLRGLLRLAAFQTMTNDYEGAGETLAQALRQAQDLTDRQSEARCWHILGRVAYYRGHCQEALQHYERALELAHSVGDESESASILNSLGLAHYMLGAYRQSLTCFEECLALCRRLADYVGQVQSLSNDSLIYWDCGQYERALEGLSQALQLSRQIGNRRNEAFTLHNMGDLYRYMGQYEESIAYLEKTLELADELAAPALKGETLNNLGRAYLEQGQLALARTRLEQALEMRETLGEPAGMVMDLSFLGRVLLGLGQESAALNYSRRALDLLGTGNVFVDWEHQTHYNHYLICRAAGRLEEAAIALERAYQTMCDLAEGMSAEGRRSFLEDVRVNRDIAQKFRLQRTQG
ncbi:MAG: tetratricopeptide repeat protein [Chloroflexia bacterium]|nr:tetratricopeptide repeat protein [Chloroflexia bacterium]